MQYLHEIKMFQYYNSLLAQKSVDPLGRATRYNVSKWKKNIERIQSIKRRLDTIQGSQASVLYGEFACVTTKYRNP